MKERIYAAGEPKRIPYEKVAAGFYACMGHSCERECGDCPYDRYNDKNDYYGESPNFCIEHLAKDAKQWATFLGSFTHCERCMCWDKRDGDGNPMPEPDKERWCQIWGCATQAEEFCSRGCGKDNKY